MPDIGTIADRASKSFVALLLAVFEHSSELPRNIRKSLLLCLDLLFIPLAVWSAVKLGLGGDSYQFTANDLLACVLTMAFSAVVFMRLGLYRAIIRFMGQKAFIALILSVSVSSLILGVMLVVTGSHLAATTPLIYWGVAIVFIGGSRLIVRASYHRKLQKQSDNVIIYGAGESGRKLLTALMHGSAFEPVFFVDDDESLQGNVINGVSVISPGELPMVVEEFSISQVLLAMPATDQQRRCEIINSLVGMPVYVRTVPDFAELVHGNASIAQIQDIEIEELLGREPVPPHPELISKCIQGKSVLVTGAGGSIGSELCKQIILARPEKLILFDLSEYALYQIERSLRALIETHSLKAEVIPLLGSVQDYRRVKAICSSFQVNTVYHAAAYKHVPLVEYNVVEGVRNNAIGTYNTAKAAQESNVETFVLVSTDKAVRPTNVMGASKRFAELILQGFAQSTDLSQGSGTRFCMVRFGNVLGSSGSVVPLFREQIKAGGPVTVTHPEVIRFFMTVQEAAELVLQASALGHGGDVFVLDMGDPVKIIDLAKRMIRLMGYEVKSLANPHGDIDIQLTGLRKGEKLYEELLVGDNVSGTGYPMILRAEEESLSTEEMERYVTQLSAACDEYDCATIRDIFLEVVSGFKPKQSLADHVWEKRTADSRAVAVGSSNVQALFPES